MVPALNIDKKIFFFLFNKLLFDHGFFLSGLEKGAADGISAALQQATNYLVSRSTDIPDAETFSRNLKYRTTIDLFFITKDHIKNVEDMLPDIKCILQLPETRKMHQIMIEKKN